MKLLLDENLSPRLAHRLDDLFPGTLHVRDVALESVDDNVVWQFAMDNGFCIASKAFRVRVKTCAATKWSKHLI